MSWNQTLPQPPQVMSSQYIASNLSTEVVLLKSGDVIEENMEDLDYIISGVTLSAVSVIGLVGNLLLFLLIAKQVRSH